ARAQRSPTSVPPTAPRSTALRSRPGNSPMVTSSESDTRRWCSAPRVRRAFPEHDRGHPGTSHTHRFRAYGCGSARVRVRRRVTHNTQCRTCNSCGCEPPQAGYEQAGADTTSARVGHPDHQTRVSRPTLAFRAGRTACHSLGPASGIRVEGEPAELTAGQTTTEVTRQESRATTRRHARCTVRHTDRVGR